MIETAMIAEENEADFLNSYRRMSCSELTREGSADSERTTGKPMNRWEY